MRILTFDQFVLEPPGTIFGQATGLPHQFSQGLFRKGESYPGDEDDPSPAIMHADLVCANEETGGVSSPRWFLYPGQLEADHRFLVYDPADLDRLAAAIGYGRTEIREGGG